MEPSVLNHPRIAGVVDTLVAARGGLVTYDTGCGGREMLIAAAAQLAAETDAPLTIVEARVLHSETRALVRELQPDIRCAVISADEAALQPASSITGVLAVHADVLRDPDVRRPLLAMAHSASHLIVARHDYSDTTLDSLATPGLVLRASDLMPPPRPNPGPHIDVGEGRQAGWPGDPRWAPPSREERERRFIQLRGGRGEQDTASFDDFAELMHPGPDELSQRLAQFRDHQQRRAADYPAPAPGRPATRDHGQEQAAAHQHQHPHSPGRA